MTNKLHQVFIFSAGRGERIMPITATIPKPLVKVKEKTLLDHILTNLAKLPYLQKIIINGHYLAEQISDHLQKINNPKIIFSFEPEKLETGGGLVYAKDYINFHQPLLTINADTIWRDPDNLLDIEYLYKKWQQHHCQIMLGLKKVTDFYGYDGNSFGGGDFNMLNHNLYRFSQAMDYVFVGLQIIDPKILLNIPKKCFSMSDFYKSAVGEKGLLHNIKGTELLGKYYHVGSVENLAMAQKYFSYD